MLAYDRTHILCVIPNTGGGELISEVRVSDKHTILINIETKYKPLRIKCNTNTMPKAQLTSRKGWTPISTWKARTDICCKGIFFGSRQLKVAKMCGRAGTHAPKNKTKTWNRNETQRRSGRRPSFFKNITRSKKTQFSPPSKRTGGLAETKKSRPKCLLITKYRIICVHPNTRTTTHTHEYASESSHAHCISITYLHGYTHFCKPDMCTLSNLRAYECAAARTHYL